MTPDPEPGALQPRPDHSPARPDPTPDQMLTTRAAERITTAWTANTRRAVAYQWRQFATWCAEHDRAALPCSSETLASYAAHLADQGLAPASIDTALGCIQGRHKAEGHALNGAPARMVLRSYRREQAVSGRRARQAAALTVGQLRSMVQQADPETLSGKRDRALLLLGYNMMARRSELTALNLDDVTLTDHGLEVFVAASKTDKASAGETVAVPYGTHLDTCAVRAVLAWRAALEELGVTSGPLLRGVDRHGRLVGSSGAAGRRGTRMSPDSVNRIVRRLAKAAGLEGVSAHSLRSGPATAAAMAGAPRAWITRQGRWSPTSTAVDAYIRPADAWENNPMRRLGL